MQNDQDFRFYLSNNFLKNAVEIINNIAEEIYYEKRHTYLIDEYKLKQYVSLIQNALECLLKVPLAWKDWRLVVIDSANLSRADIDTGDFKSITFDDSVKLLKKTLFNSNLSKLKTKALYDLRMSRHKQTHYYLTLSKEQCWKLIAYGIDFCLEFYKDEIFKQFYEEHDAFGKIDLYLKEVEVYTKIRIASAKKRYTDLLPPLTYYFDCCPDCDQTAPVINSPGTVLCLYCKREDSIADIAETIGYMPNMDRNPTKQCSECLYHSMGATNYGDESESWQCVICGYFINKPQYYNNNPGGVYTKHIGKHSRRLKLRWVTDVTPRS